MSLNNSTDPGRLYSEQVRFTIRNIKAFLKQFEL